MHSCALFAEASFHSTSGGHFGLRARFTWSLLYAECASGVRCKLKYRSLTSESVSPISNPITSAARNGQYLAQGKKARTDIAERGVCEERVVILCDAHG